MSYQTFRDQSSINKNRFDKRYTSHFQSGSFLDSINLKLCESDIISKKEYCESMEAVRIIRRYISSKSDLIVYDICGGHGLTALLLYLLVPAVTKAYIIDNKKPPTYLKLLDSLSDITDYLCKMTEYREQDFTTLKYDRNGIIIATHACGIRTDMIIDIALKSNIPAFILPCCYKEISLPDDMKKFTNIFALRDLVDFNRINKAKGSKYNISIKLIPEKITPMNRMFILTPPSWDK